MTMQTGRLVAQGEATLPEFADLALFDQVRALLVATRLPPEPDVYDLFWRYVSDSDHHLSLAIDAVLASGRFDLGVVTALRRAHCGEVAASDVTALVEAAHDQAERLTQRIEAGQTDLSDYGRAIADGGAALGTRLDAAALAALLERLGEATATMQAANARLANELAAAAVEARGLTDQLHTAERKAVTDPLTGLLNRRGTLEAIERAQAEARAAGTRLAVAMVDIDHFKRVNDRFGHALGDEVLRFVARHLAERLPGGGTVGRLGGEEFIALLPGDDAIAGAAVIDRIRAQLAGQIIRNAADGASLGRVTFSAGVAADRPADTADSLIDRADRALYTAKRMGRDRVIPDQG